MTQAKFRAHCDSCGDVTVDITAVEIVLSPTSSGTSYRTECSTCDALIIQRADSATDELLLAADAPLVSLPPRPVLPLNTKRVHGRRARTGQ